MNAPQPLNICFSPDNLVKSSLWFSHAHTDSCYPAAPLGIQAVVSHGRSAVSAKLINLGISSQEALTHPSQNTFILFVTSSEYLFRNSF